jgi:DNA-binding Lrp family transcriptional regulator
MDEIDYLILGELFLDVQTPFLQIAKKLNISSFTVKSRYEKMVKEKTIINPTIQIDLSKLGYEGGAVLFITNLANQPKENTMKALEKIQNVLSVTETIAPYDIIACVAIFDFKNLKELVNQIKKIPSVQHIDIASYGDTIFPVKLSFGKLVSEFCRERAIEEKVK